MAVTVSDVFDTLEEADYTAISYIEFFSEKRNQQKGKKDQKTKRPKDQGALNGIQSMFANDKG